MRRAPKLPICEQYEMYNGNPVAILFRSKTKDRTEPCPFCAQTHKHGYPDGHRNDHCGDNITFRSTRWGLQEVKLTPDSIIAADGTILKRENGYIIRTRPDHEKSKRKINPSITKLDIGIEQTSQRKRPEISLASRSK